MRAITAIKTSLGKSLDFSGRASRSEFWWFVAFVSVCFIPAFMNEFEFFPTSTEFVRTETVTTSLITGEKSVEVSEGWKTQVLLFSVSPTWRTFIPAGLLIIPFFAVSVRRLHDIGYPASYAVAALGLAFFLPSFIGLIAALTLNLSVLIGTAMLLLAFPALILSYVSFVIMIAWTFANSEPGSNEYGPNPLEFAA